MMIKRNNLWCNWAYKSVKNKVHEGRKLILSFYIERSEKMAKTKKTTYPRNMIGNILIYNDKDIQYFHGVPIEIGAETGYMNYDGGRGYMQSFPTHHLLTASIIDFKQLDNITLDDTTMKRIAKFNKEIDIKKLDKEIEEKKKQIDELDSILQDREGRIDKLKDFIKDIYTIDLNEDEEDYWDD